MKYNVGDILISKKFPSSEKKSNLIVLFPKNNKKCQIEKIYSNNSRMILKFISPKEYKNIKIDEKTEYVSKNFYVYDKLKDYEIQNYEKWEEE